MLEMHGVKIEYDEFFVKLLSLCDSFNQNNLQHRYVWYTTNSRNTFN